MAYKSKDDENITKTMQERKSGIYMDRTNGKLPMDRVKGHYQERDAMLPQIQELKNIGEGFKHGAKSFIKDAEKVGGIIKENVIDPVVDAKNKTFGKNFIEDNIVTPIKRTFNKNT